MIIAMFEISHRLQVPHQLSLLHQFMFLCTAILHGAGESSSSW